jgi:hypothetical protein
MANRRNFQVVHRGIEVKAMPRSAGVPAPLVGADLVPALIEEGIVPPLTEDDGILAATGEIQIEPVVDFGGPVSDPTNSEPLFA